MFAHFLTRVREDIAVDGGIAEQQESSTSPHMRCVLSRLSERHFLEKISPSEKNKYEPEHAKFAPISAKRKSAKEDPKRLCKLLSLL
ncbi:hypothetical protein EVAR_57105_1 [Eumeta japonica]|uniref:Uncharacterized protein n=1 Tax=Eumeta variegata TaxID=151549 RepID=A0A4C1YES1_EUMVA|nr:hypothetical protein EVAR_57105_1 [Eumeta japonica]